MTGATTRDRAARLLTERVIPFWNAQPLDPSGGYYERFSSAGLPENGPKHALTQARHLWYHSRLLSTPFGNPGSEPAAEHGFAFIRDFLWDHQRGGVNTAVEASRPEPVKHFYDQLMALDALAEFSVATASTPARSLAEDLVAILRDRFHDSEGGYFEGLSSDWTQLRAGTGLIVDEPSHKSISTHLNGLHVLAEFHGRGLGDLTPEIAELLEIVDVRSITEGSFLMGERFRRDWSRQIGKRSVSYGHDLERIWMASAARRLIGEPAMSRRKAFDEIVRWGWDRRSGGFFFSGPPAGPAHDLRKQWWVQVEALVAILELTKGPPDERHGGFLEKTLQWIEECQADRAGGELHDTIDVRGRHSGAKASKWKTGYHNLRSLLAVVDAPGDTN